MSALMVLSSASLGTFCPASVVGNDASVSCEDHCQSLGYLAGQGGWDHWDDACRCRKVESTCGSDSVMQSGGMCYYDVCTIAKFCPASVLGFDASVSCEDHCESLGYLAGQGGWGHWDDACRCRKVESTCGSNSVMQSGGMCYYDVCKIAKFCPASVVGNDASVSCEDHCESLGYLAGQGGWGHWDDACRCRKEESTCGPGSVMQSGGMCYYDVCTISPPTVELLKADESPVGSSNEKSILTVAAVAIFAVGIIVGVVGTKAMQPKTTAGMM